MGPIGEIAMEEKRKDLKAEKQKKLLQRLVEELSRENHDLYYQPTSSIALVLKSYIQDKASLNKEDRDLLEPLSQHDIQIILSLHS